MINPERVSRIEESDARRIANVNNPRSCVRTAARLFAAKGFHATSMSELERAVGLGRGALYHHISSKQQLLYDLCCSHVEEMVAFGDSSSPQICLRWKNCTRSVAGSCARLPTTGRRLPFSLGKSIFLYGSAQAEHTDSPGPLRGDLATGPFRRSARRGPA